MVGSCRFESLFTYYTIILVAFGVLYRNSCQEAMEDLEMWDCTAVSSMVGSEARVLCYCATDDVFSSSLHSFMVLSHCLLYHRDQRTLSAVVLSLRRCRVVSSHYSIILFYHRTWSVALGSHSYTTNSYSSTHILLRDSSLRAELKSSWVSAYSLGPLKCQIHECSHLCSHQDQALSSDNVGVFSRRFNMVQSRESLSTGEPPLIRSHLGCGLQSPVNVKVCSVIGS